MTNQLITRGILYAPFKNQYPIITDFNIEMGTSVSNLYINNINQNTSISHPLTMDITYMLLISDLILL